MKKNLSFHFSKLTVHKVRDSLNHETNNQSDILHVKNEVMVTINQYVLKS